MDRLDAARKVEISPEKIIADLEEARLAAMAKESFPSAIRCSELQGRHIGMWRNEQAPAARTLEQILADIPKLKEEDV